MAYAWVMDHESQLERLEAQRASGTITQAQYDVRRAQVIAAASRRDLSGLYKVLAVIGITIAILFALGQLLG